VLGVAVGSAEHQSIATLARNRAVALEDNVIWPREGAVAIEPDMDLKGGFIRRIIAGVVTIPVDKAVPSLMPIGAHAPVRSWADSNSQAPTDRLDARHGKRASNLVGLGLNAVFHYKVLVTGHPDTHDNRDQGDGDHQFNQSEAPAPSAFPATLRR
jgi:hypothetical protein